MHADVVYKFIFGFERLASAQTLVPHAHMTQALEPGRYVLAGDVLHKLMHGAETLVANGCRRPPKPMSRTSSVYPFTNELGFDGWAFREIQQTVHCSAAASAALLSDRDRVGSLKRRGDDARGPGVVVPQRRDQAIVPGHSSRPLHAVLGGLPRSGPAKRISATSNVCGGITEKAQPRSPS